MVWLGNIGLINHKENVKLVTWKQMKDLFGMVKTVAIIIRDCLKIHKRGKTIRSIEAELQKCSSLHVRKENGMFDLIKRYMMKRSKQRFQFWALIRNVLRLLMLNTRLSYFHITALGARIFAIFGLIENFLGILKLFDPKKKMVKFQNYNSDRIKAVIKQKKQKEL